MRCLSPVGFGQRAYYIPTGISPFRASPCGRSLNNVYFCGRHADNKPIERASPKVLSGTRFRISKKSAECPSASEAVNSNVRVLPSYAR
eukprot:6212911-Pleurochrysis_carterae.AAC.3